MSDRKYAMKFLTQRMINKMNCKQLPPYSQKDAQGKLGIG